MQHQIGCRSGVPNNVTAHYKNRHFSHRTKQNLNFGTQKQENRHKFAPKFVIPQLVTRTISASKKPTTARPLFLQCYSPQPGETWETEVSKKEQHAHPGRHFWARGAVLEEFQGNPRAKFGKRSAGKITPNRPSGTSIL